MGHSLHHLPASHPFKASHIFWLLFFRLPAWHLLPSLQVYLARSKSSGEVVGLKVIPLQKLDAQTRRSLQAEIKLQTSLLHPNLLQLVSVSRSERYIFLALEYCDGGDMAQYLKKHGPLKEVQARAVIQQVAAGLQHLFQHKYVHRDLKLSNLLLKGKDVSWRGVMGAGQHASWWPFLDASSSLWRHTRVRQPCLLCPCVLSPSPCLACAASLSSCS